MSTTNKRMHFFVGLSTLTAIGILIVLLCTVFTPNFFRPQTTIETYFTDSINGLSPGSPVKFKGVDIGKVTSISLSSETYPEHHINLFSPNKSVAVVRMMVYLDDKEVARQAPQLIKEGLKIQTELTGLTGTLYLALNFLDPKLYPPQTESFPWKPKYTYIPSTISLTNEILSNIENFFATLQSVKSEVAKNSKGDPEKQRSALEVMTDLNNTLRSIDPQKLQTLLTNAENYLSTSQDVLNKVNVQTINSLLRQLTETTSRLNQTAKGIKGSDLIKELNNTFGGANKALSVDQYAIRELILRVKDLTESLNSVTQEVSETVGPLSAPASSGNPLQENR